MKFLKFPSIIKKAYSEKDRKIWAYPFSFFFGFLFHTLFFIIDRIGYDVSLSINKKHPRFIGSGFDNRVIDVVLLLQGPPGRLKNHFIKILNIYSREFKFKEIIYSGWEDFQPKDDIFKTVNNGKHSQFINSYEKQRICILNAVKDLDDNSLILKLRADSYLQRRDAALTLSSIYKLVYNEKKNPIIVIEQQKPIYNKWLSDHLIFTNAKTLKRLFCESYNKKLSVFNSKQMNMQKVDNYTPEVIIGKNLKESDFIFSINANLIGYKYLKYASWQADRWNWASMPELFNASREGYYAESNIGLNDSINKLLNDDFKYSYEKYNDKILNVYQKDITK